MLQVLRTLATSSLPQCLCSTYAAIAPDTYWAADTFTKFSIMDANTAICKGLGGLGYVQAVAQWEAPYAAIIGDAGVQTFVTNSLGPLVLRAMAHCAQSTSIDQANALLQSSHQTAPWGVVGGGDAGAPGTLDTVMAILWLGITGHGMLLRRLAAFPGSAQDLVMSLASSLMMVTDPDVGGKHLGVRGVASLLRSAAFTLTHTDPTQQGVDSSVQATYFLAFCNMLRATASTRLVAAAPGAASNVYATYDEQRRQLAAALGAALCSVPNVAWQAARGLLLQKQHEGGVLQFEEMLQAGVALHVADVTARRLLEWSVQRGAADEAGAAAVADVSCFLLAYFHHACRGCRLETRITLDALPDALPELDASCSSRLRSMVLGLAKVTWARLSVPGAAAPDEAAFHGLGALLASTALLLAQRAAAAPGGTQLPVLARACEEALWCVAPLAAALELRLLRAAAPGVSPTLGSMLRILSELEQAQPGGSWGALLDHLDLARRVVDVLVAVGEARASALAARAVHVLGELYYSERMSSKLAAALRPLQPATRKALLRHGDPDAELGIMLMGFVWGSAPGAPAAAAAMAAGPSSSRCKENEELAAAAAPAAAEPMDGDVPEQPAAAPACIRPQLVQAALPRAVQAQLEELAHGAAAWHPAPLPGGFLTSCDNPVCTNLSGDSEQELPLPGLCGQCRRSKYCRKECQIQHWAMHKATCTACTAQAAAPP